MGVTWLDMVGRVARAAPSAEAPEQAVLTVVDTVGVIRAGFREPEMRRLLATGFDLADTPGKAPGATVLASPVARGSATAAAFLNGTAGSFLELDEGIRPTGHPAMQVVPAALAAGEGSDSSGAEVLTAVVTGYEVAARLFRSYRLEHPVHPHGHFGAVGAAVSAALLLDVDVTEAAAIAATSPLMTSWNACLEGATARNAWMGYAAANGLNSAGLASAGFRGSRASLDDLFGPPSAPEHLEAEIDLARPALGTAYRKRHSSCALTHTAIDAALALAPRITGSISSITVETVESGRKVAVHAVPNDLSTRFSLSYAVATAILLRSADPEAMSWRPEVADLQQLVTVVVAPDLQERWPAESPARLTVTTTSGRFHEQVDNPHGHWTDPLGPAEIRDKYLRNTGGDTVGWDVLMRLHEYGSIGTALAEVFGGDEGAVGR